MTEAINNYVQHQDIAKYIADLIPSLSHEELTALSHLMYLQRDKIERTTRDRLAGK